MAWLAKTRRVVVFSPLPEDYFGARSWLGLGLGLGGGGGRGSPYLFQGSGRAPGIPLIGAELGGQRNQGLDKLQVVEHLHHAGEVFWRRSRGEVRRSSFYSQHSALYIDAHTHSVLEEVEY